MSASQSREFHPILGRFETLDSAVQWLAGLGVRDPHGFVRSLDPIDWRGAPADLLDRSLTRLARAEADSPDPAMVLANFARLLETRYELPTILTWLDRGRSRLEGLVKVFGTSQYFSNLIIAEPEILSTLGEPAPRLDREGLIETLWPLALAHPGDDQVQRELIRRFRRRQMLRIGYNDLVRELPLETTIADLSSLAEACVEAACRIARSRVATRFGEARGADGRPARFVVMALGKLGGGELNYSSDIDLIFLYDAEGRTGGPNPLTHGEYFARLGSELIRILADHTPLGQAYRVDMRLRPEGQQGPLARSLASMLGYYETMGRTWERQALIKCRPIAGDIDLGRTFLTAIQPFIYRQHLSSSEIFEIKAMKRRIEARTASAGDDFHEVKTGRGGIRDVEFVVQFLQLLHGGQDVSVRDPSTLVALERLEDQRCISGAERECMETTYRFLRKIEHRLQVQHDLQTHSLPRDPGEMLALAQRMGYKRQSASEPADALLQRFESDYRSRTDLNRRILNHLLHDAFPGDRPSEADAVVDLVLDPDPADDWIDEALRPYAFRNPATAYKNLSALAREDFEFLSQPRCRHFLAAIAPALLKAVSATPEPDLTLTHLERVSASLGAKSALWELFSLNPPSLTLYVELCASSRLLSSILIQNPGMIDDLLDSLVVDRAQPASAIRAELDELCRGASELNPILASFRNKEWLRIGTRDILGREPIRLVTRELADVAEAILRQVAHREAREMNAAFASEQSRMELPERWAVLALGKLGGREMTYHSDLDLVFLYDAPESESSTAASEAHARAMAQFAQRVIKALAGGDGGEPLYRVDTRLRPHGSSGPLALSLSAFRAYFASTARGWERAALCRARVAVATPGIAQRVGRLLQDVLTQQLEPTALATELASVRQMTANQRPAGDLKRGRSGLADLEFVVQYLMLTNGRHWPEVLVPNIWQAIELLRQRGCLTRVEARDLLDAYSFLRTLEARMRIIQNQTSMVLPTADEELARLARRSSSEGFWGFTPAELRDLVRQHTSRISELFDLIVGGARTLPSAVGPPQGGESAP